MKKYNFTVFIGRFQPLTLAHEKIIRKALSMSTRIILVIGSEGRSRSCLNPFTADERIEMIKKAFPEDYTRMIFLPEPDSNYNFDNWLSMLKADIEKVVPSGCSVCLMKHIKDNTSYYLDYFPEWKEKVVLTLFDNLSATNIRESFFSLKNDWTFGVSNSVIKYLQEWKSSNPSLFQTLYEEFKSSFNYKKLWEKSPYKPIFVTTDSLVEHNGKILLITRKNYPGKKLYALPGGYLEHDELIADGAYRELVEETGISLTKSQFKECIRDVRYVDDPRRDSRGRMITLVHRLKLKEDVTIQAGDDALDAKWVPISSLSTIRDRFYADHYQMIMMMLSYEGLFSGSDF